MSYLLYYDDFELIDNELYSYIFKKTNMKIYGECYFSNNKICIKLPSTLNNKKSSSVLFVYGALNNDHIFKARYLLEYNSEILFKTNFIVTSFNEKLI